MTTSHSISIHRVPAALTRSEEKRFLLEVARCMTSERPRAVLDCSDVRVMDDAVVHLLLCCLEEAMKNNGDLKLPCLARQAQAVLRGSGAGRLFESYPTLAAATGSFHAWSVLEPVVSSAVTEHVRGTGTAA